MHTIYSAHVTNPPQHIPQTTHSPSGGVLFPFLSVRVSTILVWGEEVKGWQIRRGVRGEESVRREGVWRMRWWGGERGEEVRGVRFTRRLNGAGVYFSLLAPAPYKLHWIDTELPRSYLLRSCFGHIHSPQLHRYIVYDRLCFADIRHKRDGLVAGTCNRARIAPRGHCHALPFDPAFNWDSAFIRILLCVHPALIRGRRLFEGGV